MRLGRIGERGREIPVAAVGEAVYDLTPVTRDIDGEFLAAGGIDLVRERIAAGALPRLADALELRVGAPVARPQAVYCIGMNYAAHAAESGNKPPENMVMFLKSPNTVSGPDDDVEIPFSSVKTDWEVELAVVIGRRAWRLGSEADVASYVAGYTVGNDLSERDWQIAVSGGQWSKGKSAPGFLPLGPWLVTPDEIDPTGVRLRSWVNGQVRQDSNTADMIFPVDHVVWELSQYLVLEPGDVILTGTPQGVALSGRFPYLKAGDVVELEIDGIGRQRQAYVPAGQGRR
ncbi:MAG TPA: fumarylacetoacetate hydrolase family protein [Microbacteriaceae bacterium]|nr:fumarylacetoacetate hydrolase family protein [Microbacteriaceae bacterium]